MPAGVGAASNAPSGSETANLHGDPQGLQRALLGRFAAEQVGMQAGRGQAGRLGGQRGELGTQRRIRVDIGIARFDARGCAGIDLMPRGGAQRGGEGLDPSKRCQPGAGIVGDGLAQEGCERIESDSERRGQQLQPPWPRTGQARNHGMQQRRPLRIDLHAGQGGQCRQLRLAVDAGRQPGGMNPQRRLAQREAHRPRRQRPGHAAAQGSIAVDRALQRRQAGIEPRMRGERQRQRRWTSFAAWIQQAGHQARSLHFFQRCRAFQLADAVGQHGDRVSRPGLGRAGGPVRSRAGRIAGAFGVVRRRRRRRFLRSFLFVQHCRSGSRSWKRGWRA
ncbi:hypothetical protein [Burkholderia gladioli]|uniref:hypothetical protein n=1 Tax=Burkholderia gladioli TaxID=28095 RepID=UPI00163F64BE|nr:hypothetical protein [Burkholderia gladioli]